MLLGCIGDDFTGSSDLANTLAKQGMATTLYAGRPHGSAAAEVEAGVIALKSRSIPAAEAVRLSLDAADWLADQGCRQFVFKYCSTFDSTPEGNIGPVADALADRFGVDRVIVCPAFPEAGRTIYQGHLFVNDALLSESGMEHHPLTPMTDPDIRRWLKRQARSGVGHAPLSVVRAGAEAIAARIEAEAQAGRRLVVVDALDELDLVSIGRAAQDMALVTGGSGVAQGLPDNFRMAGEIEGVAAKWTGQSGPCVILSGSCSRATRGQIARHKERQPALEATAEDVMSGAIDAERAARWALEAAADGAAPLIYSSADPAVVKAAQERFGRESVAAAIEALFAETARRLVAGGAARLITAGGETSSAVVEGLGVGSMAIGPEIDPGVPAMRAGESLVVALKSGNFGVEEFFEKAAAVLAGDAHGDKA